MNSDMNHHTNLSNAHKGNEVILLCYSIVVHFFIRTRGLFFLEISEQIKYDANLGIKKKNTGEYNAL